MTCIGILIWLCGILAIGIFCCYLLLERSERTIKNLRKELAQRDKVSPYWGKVRYKDVIAAIAIHDGEPILYEMGLERGWDRVPYIPYSLKHPLLLNSRRHKIRTYQKGKDLVLYFHVT